MRTCRLVEVQDRDNPISGCNWQTRRQEAKTKDARTGDACARACVRSRFSPDVSFLSAKEREKEKREQTYLLNGTMFPSLIHPPGTNAD